MLPCRYADKTFPRGDPLHYLYKLFAGRGPAATSILSEEEISHWPEVLATLLSNPTSGDTDMMRQLGDSLLAAGDVCAAHSCYLSIEVSQGPRTVLLYGARGGSDATPESIQRTEIAEYAASLSGVASDFATFLPFKLAYATWLADCKMFNKTLDYCDIIARSIQALSPTVQRSTCTPALLRRLIDLEERARSRYNTPRPSTSNLWKMEV